MRELLLSLSILCTVALFAWFFFAIAALSTLRNLGAPVTHWTAVFLAPIGYRPAIFSLLYLLHGQYRTDTMSPIPPHIERTRTIGRVIVGAWIVVTPIVGLLWLARAI